MTVENVRQWYKTLPEHVRARPFWQTMSEDQLLALYAICTMKYDCVTLLGRAGSGKTFVTKAAAQLLKELGAEVRVVATTGVASQNVSGEGTVNKLLGLGIGEVLPDGLVDFTSDRRKRQSPSSCAKRVAHLFPTSSSPFVLFLDELSMASSELLVVAYQTLTKLLPNREVHLVCVGDLRQLLPVFRKDETAPWQEHCSLSFETAKFSPVGEETFQYGSVLTNGPFLPEQQCEWRSLTLSLVTNHRQADADGWFVDALNSLGDGADFSTPLVEPLLSRVWVNKSGTYQSVRGKKELPNLDQALHLYTRNSEVRAHNQRALEAAKEVIYQQALQQIEEKGVTEEEEKESVINSQFNQSVRTYRAKVGRGQWSIEEILQEVAPLEQDCEVAVGMRFMVRLNLDERLSNGTVGTIIELGDERIRLRLDSGEVYWVNYCDVPLPIGKSGNPVGSYKGLPGHLAHATTPWKCQGLTVKEDLVFHLNDWRSTHGLMYVACSRVTNPENLFILADHPKMLNKSIFCQPEVKEFISLAETNTERLLSGEEALLYQESISQPESEPVFVEQGNLLFVRGHQVTLCPYIASPKGEVVLNKPHCTIHKIGEMQGMCINDRAVVETMLKDDNVLAWFVNNIQYVWFKPCTVKEEEKTNLPGLDQGVSSNLSLINCDELLPQSENFKLDLWTAVSTRSEPFVFLSGLAERIKSGEELEYVSAQPERAEVVRDLVEQMCIGRIQV